MASIATQYVAGKVGVNDMDTSTISGQAIQTVANNAVSMGVNKLILNQNPQIEQMAIQALGSQVGTEIGKNMGGNSYSTAAEQP